MIYVIIDRETLQYWDGGTFRPDLQVALFYRSFERAKRTTDAIKKGTLGRGNRLVWEIMQSDDRIQIVACDVMPHIPIRWRIEWHERQLDVLAQDANALDFL